MKQKRFLQILTLVLTVGFASQALADRDRDFRRGQPRWAGNERSERVRALATGQPVYGGSGCPEGTMNVAFAPDFLSFTILFDQFVAQTSPDTKQRRDLMTCNAVIPIDIPKGMQMEITRVDFRGFVGLPEGSRANLHSVFNFLNRGRDGSRMNMRFQFAGPVMDNYEISSDVLETEVSPCGGPVRLRVVNQLKVVSRAKGPAATATIDSIDGASNAVYYVNWRACR